MTTDAPAIEFRRVGKTIDGSALLDDVSFTIAAGERVALIGPSGAGKTTVLRMAAGVLWPSEGKVLTLGQVTGELGPRALCRLRKQVGFLYQQDNLVPGLRVAHNVLMGRLGRWSLWRAALSLLWPRELDQARAALARVELAHRLWAMPDELSGGEQQRVAIARLLLQAPRVLLADEPVSALDIRLGREIVRLLLDVAAQARSTLLVSLHTLPLLGEGFDRVIALRAGQIVWQGRPADVSHDLLLAVYGTDYRALELPAKLGGSATS